MVKHPSKSKNSSKLKKGINKCKTTNNSLKNVTKKWSIKTGKSYIFDTKIIRIESSSGTNYYKKTKYKPRPGEKRMVLIDGGNVAHFDNSNSYSVETIHTALMFFINRGYECKAVVSQSRLRKSESTNHSLMQQLVRAGYLIITPGKILPSSQPTSSCERFILQIALEFDAVIISNDRYSELVAQNSEFKTIVDRQLLGYTFNNGMFHLVNAHHADDLLNRRG